MSRQFCYFEDWHVTIIWSRYGISILVYYHLKLGMAGLWWGVMAEADETAQAAMAEK